MELVVKHFSELSAEELFKIYKLRVSVFIVEQKCPYQEVDDADKVAYHVWLQDEDGIEAYARVLPSGTAFPSVSMGRVIAVKRRCGLGSKVVAAAISVAKESVQQTKLQSKRRYMHVLCTKKQAFTKYPKNFWKMAFRMFGCS